MYASVFSCRHSENLLGEENTMFCPWNNKFVVLSPPAMSSPFESSLLKLSHLFLSFKWCILIRTMFVGPSVGPPFFKDQVDVVEALQ